VVGRPPSISTQVQIRHHPYHGIGDRGLRFCKPSGCSLSLQLLSGGGDVFMRVIYIPMHILVYIPFIFILCLCRRAENHHLDILTSNNLLHQTIKKATQVNLTLRLLMSYIYGAPSKARNANVVYIWTYVWQR